MTQPQLQIQNFQTQRQYKPGLMTSCYNSDFKNVKSVLKGCSIVADTVTLYDSCKNLQ